MVVGIIAANRLRYSPYVLYYVNILKDLDIEYEILVPQRNKKVKDIDEDYVHEFEWDDHKQAIINYMRYCHEVKMYSINRFDFMIALTTNIAVFSNNWLKKYFDKKYIIDIRDYTYENNKVFYMLEKKAILHAALRVISSSKFQTFLPKNEYLVCHNNTWSDKRKEVSGNHRNVTDTNSIVIGYVGAVAYRDQCEKLMDLVKNDTRFEFHIYGDGIAQKDLMNYADKIQCGRIKFYGKYLPEEKERIIKKIDILFNAYGNDSPLVKYALSNKLYDALYFEKPVLNSPNTYMSEMCGPLSYEIDLDKEKKLAGLFNWFIGLDKDIIEAYSNQQYLNIIEEEKITRSKIKYVLINAKEN